MTDGTPWRGLPGSTGWLRRSGRRPTTRQTSFTVRRVGAEPPPGAVPSRTGSAGARQPAGTAEVSPWRTLGRFRSERAALSCLAALLDAGEPRWSCHRSPVDGLLWLLTAVPPLVGGRLVAACGGRAFAVLPDGTVPTPPGGPRDTGTVRRWPVVDALGLAQRCPASELLPEPPHRAVVLTVPQLLDTVLRRALAAGVDTTLLTVGVSRLYPAGPNPVPPVETVLVLLSGAQDVGAQDAGAGDLQALPSVLLRALAELPRTFVCRRATPWDRLLVDLRMRLPIADMHLGPTVPEDELWLLPDPAQSPPLRLGVTGRPVPLPLVPDGADSGVPDPGTPDFEILSGGVDSSEQRSWPKPGAEPLRVVPGRSPAARAADTRTAGVLLDDGQLDLLRRYLPGRPLAERAFLVLGDGAHLLIEATELIASLPFGVPLNRLGPGACLIEAGHVLTPPLPPAARIRTFGLTDNSVTVCCPQGFLRFDLAHLVPAWALWAPPQLPAVPSALSVEAERILEAAAAILGIAEAGGAGTARITVIDPSVLLQDAARLRAQGRFAEAAAAFRQAGEMLEAGRLFEQAAFQAPVDP